MCDLPNGMDVQAIVFLARQARLTSMTPALQLLEKLMSISKIACLHNMHFMPPFPS